MSEELRENKAFISFEGFMGRYDYFLNLVLLNMIAVLFTLPLTGSFLTSAGNIDSLFNLHNLFLLSPLWVKIWGIIGSTLISYIIISNVFRRLNDINGEEKKNFNIAISTVFALANFSYIFPNFLAIIFYLTGIIVAFWVLLKKGKLTGEMPYDFKKEFNWGAFFGTWIWGLFNKSYKTLLMLILWFTPWNILFAVYCGIKGNEWASENRNWDSLEKFKSSQEKQTAFWAIFSVILIPAIIFILIFSMAFFTIMHLTSSEDSTKIEQTLEKLENTMNSLSSLYFEGHELTSTENKFYVLSDDWARYTFTEKKDIFDMATNMAVTERNKADRKTNYTKMSELHRTKIYSKETNQLLGEYIMDKNIEENGSFQEYISAAMKAYQFYKPIK